MTIANPRLRILAVLDILLERSDEKHRLNARQLSDILEKEYGFTTDRRTLYAEVETLMEYGIDIHQMKGRHGGYYVVKRDFDFAELKLLVDAVQSSKFISEEDARRLIRKLESLCNRYEAKELSGQVTIINRPRTGGDDSYAQVGLLHEAIYRSKKIRFQYTTWNARKQRVPRHEGQFYTASPLSLVYAEEKYYLVAYDEEAQIVKHFRVDKIISLSVLEEAATPLEFDAPSFARKTFSMYGGEDVNVVLRGKESLVGTLIDHFGIDIFLHPEAPGYFKAGVMVSVSPTFFGWIMGLGDGIEILKPCWVREAFKEHVQKVLQIYDPKEEKENKESGEGAEGKEPGGGAEG